MSGTASTDPLVGALTPLLSRAPPSKGFLLVVRSQPFSWSSWPGVLDPGSLPLPPRPMGFTIIMGSALLVVFSLWVQPHELTPHTPFGPLSLQEAL